MYLSQHEANLLECSIFHYFIWRQQEGNKNLLDVDDANHHNLCSNNNNKNYKRIIKVLKKELKVDVATTMSYETPNLFSTSTPEVCFRWLNNATLHDNNNDDISPGKNKKRKRDMLANETVNLVKTLQSPIQHSGEDTTTARTITLENAKEIISTLREEHTEVKIISDSLESKLIKSEKIYSELLKFHKKKIRLEKKIAKLQQSEEEGEANRLANFQQSDEAEANTTTEQIVFDVDHHVVNDMEEVEEQQGDDFQSAEEDDFQSVEEANKTTEQIILDDNHNGNEAMEEVGEQGDKLKSLADEANKNAEQIILDDDHHNGHKAMEEEAREQQGDHQESNNDVRAKLETKKRRVQLQETLYTNAILYEVDNENKEQQQMKIKIKMNREKNFELRLQQLIEFKQEFGHCEPSKSSKDRDLYGWLTKQRRYYRWKNMLPDRIAKLDALGMVWDPNSSMKRRSIDGYLEQCRTFKETYGHLRIPLPVTGQNEDGTEPSEDDIKFRLWAQSMRTQYQRTVSGGKNGLDRPRIAILDSLGFEWSIPDASTSVEEGGGNIDVEVTKQSRSDIMFRTRFEQLRKIKETHGDCNVKKHVLSVYPNNTSLILWAKGQRKQMKNCLAGVKSTLTEERLEMLRSINFDHDPRKYCKPHPTIPKKRFTKMEKLAIQLQQEKQKQQTKNNHENDSENDNGNSDDDNNSDID